jgi:gliding motility-associated-like protein
MRKLYSLLSLIAAFAPTLVYGQSPVEYIKNNGQWGNWIQYKASTPGGDIYLEKKGLRYVLGDADNEQKIDGYHHGTIKTAPSLKFHAYLVSFEGANDAVLTGTKQQNNYYNYYLGNDPKRWASGIHPNLDVDYNGLYDGINMHVSSQWGHLVYEFHVQPGADADKVKMKFEGQDELKIKENNLVIGTSVGQVLEIKPYAYQYINDVRTEVRCYYKLKGNVLSYYFPDDYDHSKLLVIDPTVVFCSFTGSTADNWGFTATYDNQGNFYAGGLVNCTAFGGQYPVSPGAFQVTYGGGYTSGNYYAYGSDIAIMKFNPSGSNRVYATYIGGDGNERPHSMIVDASGNLIIAGRSISQNYPVTASAFQPTNHGDYDIVVTKLNATGTALIGSTYVGGSGVDGVNYDSTEYLYGELKFNYGDDARSEVQVDNAGNIYVTGSTSSTNFPTTATAVQTTLSGQQDGVVFKMNSTLTSMLWGTYIGGTGSDAGYVLAFDNTQQSVYVGGGTNSPNFPVTAGSWKSSFQGGTADGFILKFKNSAPYNILKGTYVGTSNYDQVYGIGLDNNNNVYCMGQSLGGAFPVTAGVYSNPNSSQFVMEMSNDLSTDMASTVYGSGDPAHTNISPVAFLVDTCNNVYVSGWGGNLANLEPSTAGTCTGMATTTNPPAVQSTTDGYDFYFIVFGSGLATLRYATFYGRNSTDVGQGEHVDGGTSRFDKNGIIYQAICGNCRGSNGNTGPGGGDPPFPTTAGAWAEIDSNYNCNEIALKIAFEIGPVTADVSATPSTHGCAPLTVNFTNLSSNGISYIWNFGDGTTATTFNATHTFTNPGVYQVYLSAANSNSCISVTDTFFLTVVVDTNQIKPSFTYALVDSCNPYTATFGNTSQYGTEANAQAQTTFQWFFGDGTNFTGTTPPIHNFPDTGYYVVTLVMTDTNSCNSPDTVRQVVRFKNEKVKAKFYAPDTICVFTTITVIDSSQNATNYYWTFGDNGTSGNSSPSHAYNTPGVYTITLIVNNPKACKPNDTITRVIVVQSGPVANFSFTPTTPETNVPIDFTNLSTNATRYFWDFGDNTSGVEVNPSHLYKKSGYYNVCLSAFNGSNCPSKICKSVNTDIQPLADIPSGFSPNGDGKNDILYVRGADITSMDLKIYNRWGELIFESKNQEVGWDGTFNGKPQPMEAYAFTLNVTFGDGTTMQKKGNVTLLR